jgi:predicted Zn-dependent protease
MKGASIKRSVLDALEKNIQAITGKKTRVLVSDEQIAYVQNLDQTAIKKIVTQSRNYLSLDNTAMVYLIVGGSDEKDPTQIGSTFEEYGIVLYLDTLKKYANAKEENFDAYAEGIILHEFGHLLGLNHNSDQGCLMNSNTEFTNAYVEKGKIITDFCLAEKNAIRQMKY